MPSDNYEEIFNARPADGSGWVAHSNIFFLLFCYSIHLNIETNLVGFLRIIFQATNAKTKIDFFIKFRIQILNEWRAELNEIFLKKIHVSFHLSKTISTSVI